MRRMIHLCLTGFVIAAGISPALAADPPHDPCSESLVAIEMRDTAALHAYARFIEADMAGLNGVARGAGTGTVDFSDPRWGTPELRGQQVAALCRQAPRMPFQEAVLRVYHGYRVSSGLGTIVPPRGAPVSGIVERQLAWLLRPIQPLLDDPAVTDLHINGPDPDGRTTTVFAKRGAQRSEHQVALSLAQLENIADNAAALMRQDVAEDAPFCAARLPQGQRVQIARPPAVPEGRYALAIRRPSATTPTIGDLVGRGVFARTRSAEHVRAHPPGVIAELLALKAAERWADLIALAIRSGLNVVWAGKVGTGKTTNLRAFLEAVPLDWRLVTVEDMEEVINLRHRNVVNLLYPKGRGQGVSDHTAEDCIEAALRLDMDMLVNQELRDGAAWAYLRALNSGHPGMTSCHAPSAEGAFRTIGLMVRQNENGRSLANEDLQATLRDLIDVVAYCETDGDGRRGVTQVYFDPEQRRGVPAAAASLLAA